MNELRVWIHDEAPEGKPSAAAARLGCKCADCKAALAAYLREYRASRQHEQANADGSAVYHNHGGQPSRRSARKNLCVHPRCLSLAGLALNDKGAVVSATTGIVDATWGAVAGVAA